MIDTIDKLDPRTIEDMRIRYRAAMLEIMGTHVRHMEYAGQYLEDGNEWFATFHLGQAKLCFKRLIQTHNELVALGEKGGAHE